MKNYKYSVVTTNFNNYENIQEVKNPREDVEYILVTDDTIVQYKTWKVVIFNDYDKLISPELAWIYVKWFTFNYCTANICLYIDGSTKILNDFTNLIEYFINNNYEYAAAIDNCYRTPEHMLLTWGENNFHGYNSETAQIVLKHLKNSGLNTTEFGLLNTSFLLKKNTKFTRKIDEDTWTNLSTSPAGIKGYRIMEPAFLYSLNKNAYQSDKILILDHFIKWSNWFSWCFHNTNNSSATSYNSGCDGSFYIDNKYEWIFQNKLIKPVSYTEINSFNINKFPLLTVVVTAYNKQDTIKRTLLSIKQTTYPNWECIIVDNDSEDNTKNIVLETIENDYRFTYVRQRNKNLCNSRNVGANIGNGKYLIHVDGDDTIDKNFCYYAISEMEKNKDICASTGPLKRVSSNNQYFYNLVTNAINFSAFSPEDRVKFICHCGAFPVETVLKMNIFKKIDGFREGLESFVEDGEMFIRYFDAALPHNNVYYISNITTVTLYEQNNSKSSITEQSPTINFNEYYKYNKDIYEKYMNKEEIEKIKNLIPF